MQTQSDDIQELVKSLIEVQDEIRDVEKASKGQVGQQVYWYANLESVIEATRVPFARNGLVVSQLSGVHEGKMVLITLLMHSSGQWLKSVMPVMNERNTAQSLGSGLTYARRYSLAALAGVTQTDDDGEEASKPALKPSGAPSPIKPALAAKEAYEIYVIPIGKYTGQTFDQIAIVELANYVAEIELASAQANKKPSAQQANMLSMAHKYLESKS